MAPSSAHNEENLMRWNRPTVDAFMTRAPVVVSPGDPLSSAMHTMLTHRIRHLPVCEGGRVVGVVSQRDVYYTQAHEGAGARRRRDDALRLHVGGRGRARISEQADRLT
jgi:CBS domain-containing protein